MKKLLSILVVAALSFTAKGQTGDLGKPNGTNDTISSAGTYTMAINNAGTPLNNKKQLAVQLNIKAVDSVKTAYVKLQARIKNTWCDVGTAPTDSTAFNLVETTTAGTTHGYIITPPAKLTPTLNLQEWRLVLVVTGDQKFTATGSWTAN